MKVIAILALKEVRDGLRNRWVATTILILTALSLSLYFLGSAPVGTTKVDSLEATLVSLVSLSVYLLPLIALMLSFEALVSEFERGTMLLLLTYPVARWQLIIGKFLGHMLILLLAIVVGYGSVALIIALNDDNAAQSWLAYGIMMASSWLLGGVFVAFGYFISISVRERATGMAVAIGLWLSLVVLYDLALLGALVADEKQVIGQQMLAVLIIANPTDAYRVFNLTSSDSVSQITGLAEVAAKAGIVQGVPLLMLGAWLLAGLAATIILFYRREI